MFNATTDDTMSGCVRYSFQDLIAITIVVTQNDGVDSMQDFFCNNFYVSCFPVPPPYRFYQQHCSREVIMQDYRLKQPTFKIHQKETI